VRKSASLYGAADGDADAVIHAPPHTVPKRPRYRTKERYVLASQSESSGSTPEMPVLETERQIPFEYQSFAALRRA